MSRRRRALVLSLVLLCALVASSHAAQTVAPQSPFSRRARLEPKVARVAALDLAGDSRQAFEKLAAAGGIQVVFHPAFGAAPLPPGLTLNDMNFVDALDRLALASHAFWETYDRKTILVAPDDPAIRKQVEMQALRVFSTKEPALAAALLSKALERMNVKTLAISTPQNALILRESVDNVDEAGRLMETPGAGTLLIDFAGNLHTSEAGRLRKTNALAHRELQPTNAGPISLRLENTSRDAFQALADRAGIGIVFHRQFSSGAARVFSMDDVDVFTALDLLSFQTGSFWQVINSRTIVVATENPTVRREVEPYFIKPIQLRNLKRQQEVTEVVTALRTLIGMNQITTSTPQNMVLLRDTADRLDLAERLAAVFDGSPGGLSQASTEALIPSGNFGNPVDSDLKRAMAAQLQLKSNANITLAIQQQSRQAFETLASMAGIQILFHRQFANQAAFPFAVKDVDIAAALDQLAFQSGNFWTVADPHTIVVATDNPTVRREVEQMAMKPIYLRNIVRQQEMTEFVTAIRTMLSFNQVAMSTRQNMILLRDTPDKVALAERIAAVFDRPAPGEPDKRAQAPPARAILTGRFAQPTDEDARRAEQSRLELGVRGPLSVRMNQGSRPSFETVAQMAGLQVLFHRQFANAAAFAFAVDGDDAFTALDRLAFQTGNFWQVQDPHTIVVATDNPTVRRDTEPLIVKTIYLRNLTTQAEATELVTALRTLLSLSQIGISAKTGAIVMRDTADRIALAEKIANLFDPPGGAANGPVPVASPIVSGVFADPMDSVARRARVKLALPPSADARISVEFNLSSRQAFETLAARAGIAAVAFHSSFGDAAPFAFRVRDMDFIEAMDQLAFRTGTFWQPVGNKIIEVGTNTPVARLDVERVSMRTIVLTNIQTSEDTRDIVTLLTSLISPREISNGEGIITLTDTLDRIALAEAIVAQLDVPGRTPLGRSPQPTAPPQQRGATPIF